MNDWKGEGWSYKCSGTSLQNGQTDSTMSTARMFSRQRQTSRTSLTSMRCRTFFVVHSVATSWIFGLIVSYVGHFRVSECLSRVDTTEVRIPEMCTGISTARAFLCDRSASWAIASHHRHSGAPITTNGASCIFHKAHLGGYNWIIAESMEDGVTINGTHFFLYNNSFSSTLPQQRHDSQYTKDQCTGCKPANEVRKVKNATMIAICRRLIQAVAERHTHTKWVKVKGHSAL